MSRNNFEGVLSSISRTIDENLPGFLMGLGIFGMASTVTLAVKATPKAIEKIEETKDELQKDTLSTTETVKAAGKCYIPTIVAGTASIACFIGSLNVSNRRYAALATTYQLSESAFRIYRDKVTEVVGEKKEQNIRDKAAAEQIKKVPESQVILLAAEGKTVVFDPIANETFLSDYETLRKKQNDFNTRLLSEMYLSYNEWRYENGLSSIYIGDDIGWNCDEPMDLSFTSALRGGTPCLVIDYSFSMPKHDYKF